MRLMESALRRLHRRTFTWSYIEKFRTTGCAHEFSADYRYSQVKVTAKRGDSSSYIRVLHIEE